MSRGNTNDSLHLLTIFCQSHSFFFLSLDMLSFACVKSQPVAVHGCSLAPSQCMQADGFVVEGHIQWQLSPYLHQIIPACHKMLNLAAELPTVGIVRMNCCNPFFLSLQGASQQQSQQKQQQQATATAGGSSDNNINSHKAAAASSCLTMTRCGPRRTTRPMSLGVCEGGMHGSSLQTALQWQAQCCHERAARHL